MNMTARSVLGVLETVKAYAEYAILFPEQREEMLKKQVELIARLERLLERSA